VRTPIAFVYGNCVFADGVGDPWAAFEVGLDSYAWLERDEKRRRMLAMVGALEAAEADVQLLRVTRLWDAERYGGELGHGDERAGLRQRYLEEQRAGLRESPRLTPALYILVSLREPELDLGSQLSRLAARPPGDVWPRIRRVASALERRMLPAGELERVRIKAEHTRARLSDFLALRPVRGVELQWLVRRRFCRGLGEPSVDGLHAPRALVFERNGEAVLAPLEGDVLRWLDSEVEQRARTLRIESELGTSWQAQLVLGAVPERVEFPGSRAEILFAPPESLSFELDIAVTVRFLGNETALRLARRKVQDADQIMRAEAVGEQGVSDLGYQRTQESRDLLSYLQASSHPPLLRTTIAFAVAAGTEADLEERVASLRRAYGEVRLHRPLGEQLQLFMQHLPGQRTRVAGYDDVFMAEQLAAMMPTATHRAGATRGFYLGHTLSGSQRPVLFNLAEGSEQDRNTTVLALGALGSGKTTLAQKLQYEGFLQGARVIDCDPKGDHRFHLLDDVSPHVEELTLRPDGSLRGMLDPLRIAPPHLRQEATVSFLRDLLPGRAEPGWETALVAAVDRVLARASTPTCSEVVRALSQGEALERQIGATLEIYARSGLTQLGFADPASPPPSVGDAQVTYLAIRDLPGPPLGTDRAEYSQAERVGEQIVRLIAMLALHLVGAERERLKVFSFDEGWRLLGDPIGRMLLASLQRMGRSERAVPIISTQLVGDTLIGGPQPLEDLIGATFVFGVRSQLEAERALRLLGLDPEDREMRGVLLSLDAGRCLFRDHAGRVEAVQVDLVSPALLAALSTTPRGPSGR
jgi:hypothetical protein